MILGWQRSEYVQIAFPLILYHTRMSIHLPYKVAIKWIGFIRLSKDKPVSLPPCPKMAAYQLAPFDLASQCHGAF